MHKGFPPSIDKDVRTLILGSFPGGESLRKQQYYGNPRNQFWKLLGDVTEEDLVSMEYQRRLETLLNYNIGVWDVIDACKRDGSLDSAIREEQRNDFQVLKKLAPKLERVCFNGKKAGSYEKDFAAMGYRTFVLPSSSPAHQMLSYGQKLRVWKRALS